MKKFFKAAVLAASLIGSVAHAGPFILAGTDADEHGSFAAGANQDGWLFMQLALQNIAAGSSLTNMNRQVVALGSEGLALTAAQSAFNGSTLAASGWSFRSIATLDNASFASAVMTGSIIMLDSGSNIPGGRTTAEEAVLTANAVALNNFVGAGGGLFSQAGTYGWLSSLVPGLAVSTAQFSGLALTGAGSAAFPGLNNGDLSAGPYHQNFTNVGLIPVLATGIGAQSTLNVIIGAAGGSFVNPDPVTAVPEPETYVLMLAGLAAIARIARRRKAA